MIFTLFKFQILNKYETIRSYIKKNQNRISKINKQAKNFNFLMLQESEYSKAGCIYIIQRIYRLFIYSMEVFDKPTNDIIP